MASEPHQWPARTGSSRGFPYKDLSRVLRGLLWTICTDKLSMVILVVSECTKYQIGACSELHYRKPNLLRRREYNNTNHLRLVRLLGTRMGFRYFEVPVNELQLFFGFETIGQQRLILDQLFLYKLLNEHIDCPEILDFIDFKVPRGTRSKSLFGKQFQPTTNGHHGCILHLLNDANELGSSAVFYGQSMGAYRDQLAGADPNYPVLAGDIRWVTSSHVVPYPPHRPTTRFRAIERDWSIIAGDTGQMPRALCPSVSPETLW
ncbi:hypothetical protein J6590_063583 [Homalodisca vitripennis]|nr:hypothetical protein J6590_063583 [Homalodisca vitripennis]